MKNFVVYGGMDKNNLKEILHASLKHDGTAETFDVGWREAGEADLVSPSRLKRRYNLRSSRGVLNEWRIHSSCVVLRPMKTDLPLSVCRDTAGPHSLHQVSNPAP
jgi:hypothetical protein